MTDNTVKTNMTEAQENTAAANVAAPLATGITPNMTDEQKIQFIMKNMHMSRQDAEAVIANQKAGTFTTLYNVGGMMYTRSQLEVLGFNVSDMKPAKVVQNTEATSKGGIFDNIPDWLITAAKVMLGIIAVVGVVLVVKNFVIPKFFGDRTVEYNGAEIDEIEV